MASSPDPRGRAMAVVAAAFGLMIGGSTVSTPLYVLYQQRWHFEQLLIPIVFATYVAGVLLSLFLTGSLSDQLGRRPVMLGAMGVAALANGLAVLAPVTGSFAGGMALLFASRFVLGAAVGAFTPVATASLVELEPRGDRRRAALISTIGGFVGLAAGSLLGGGLAEFAPWPLRLGYLVVIGLLALGLVPLSTMPETVTHPGGRWHPQRMAVPPEIRATFLLAASTIFVSFALAGLLGALGPTFLARFGHSSNHLLAGGVYAELYGLGAIAAIVLSGKREAGSIAFGLLLVVLGMALLMLGASFQSIPLMYGGIALSGLGLGPAYFHSLTLINRCAPEGRRAEVTAAYFVAGYIGLALPVVSEGLIARALGLYGASVLFTVLVGLLGLVTAGLIARERPA